MKKWYGLGALLAVGLALSTVLFGCSSTDSQDSCSSDSECDDSDFCNGDEYCSFVSESNSMQCFSFGSPCGDNQTCDEEADMCMDN